jgi:hypothetical protein
MALEIIRGASPEEIPVLTESPRVPMFNHYMLKKFQIKRSALPKGGYYSSAARYVFLQVHEHNLGSNTHICRAHDNNYFLTAQYRTAKKGGGRTAECPS